MRVASLRLALVGLSALTVGLGGSPVSWVLNAYWFCLLLATAIVAGIAVGRPRAGVLAGEVVVVFAAVQGLWPFFAPMPALNLNPFAASAQGVGWRMSFTEHQQALVKVFDLPSGWQRARVYLRVDLTSEYEGEAGFLVEVNGETAGLLNRSNGQLVQIGVVAPHWALELPQHALARAPLGYVGLRPAGLDPVLSIPGHRDPYIEPLGLRNSWFFDGASWRHDRLAGPAAGRASGTYRMWLHYIAD
ncbi:MAG: hypothetical protein ACR2NO_01765 [Chloroflexota bacterium]